MDFWWIICELIVWICYALAIGFIFAIICNCIIPDLNPKNVTAKVGRIMLSIFDDDDDIYETE